MLSEMFSAGDGQGCAVPTHTGNKQPCCKAFQFPAFCLFWSCGDTPVFGICQDDYTASSGWELDCLPHAGQGERGTSEVAAQSRAALQCCCGRQAGELGRGWQAAAQPQEMRSDGVSCLIVSN